MAYNIKNRSPRVAIVLGSLLFLMGQAPADSMPQMELLAQLPVLSDAKLAEIRGRFISGDTLMYFGVEMYTQWQTPDGQLLGAGLGMQVDFDSATTFKPTLTIVSNALESATSTAGASQGASNISLGGLQQVAGATQSIQVAGDRNAINNDMEIGICTGRCSGTGTDISLTGQTLDSAGTTSLLNEHGSMTTFTVNENELSLAIQVPHQGQILQQIKGTGFGSGGILQSAQIAGDRNAIRNLQSLEIGLRPGANLGGGLGPIIPALDSLKGLPGGF